MCCHFALKITEEINFHVFWYNKDLCAFLKLIRFTVSRCYIPFSFVFFPSVAFYCYTTNMVMFFPMISLMIQCNTLNNVS